MFNELNVKKLPARKALQAGRAQCLKKTCGEYRRTRAEMRVFLAVRANNGSSAPCRFAARRRMRSLWGRR